MEQRLKRRISLGCVAVGRRLFRGTWIQQLPFVTAIYRSVMRVAVGPSIEEEVTFRGSVFGLPSTDITILPSLLLDDYETVELNAFLRLVGALSPGQVVLDVGANIGLYTVLAAQAATKGVQTVAFEPVEANVRILERNLRRNGVGNVSVVGKAVGRSGGQARIFKSSADIGTHTVGGTGSSYEEVEVVSLDDFVEQSAIRVGAIKIDVEGYDGYVLEGAPRVLARDRPSVLVEYSPPTLKACGYAVSEFHTQVFTVPGHHFWIDERRRGLVPLNSTNDLSDLSWNTGSSSNILVTERADLLSDIILR